MGYTRNVERSRNYYLRSCLSNLTFLFEKRYSWMNDYIHDNDDILEVGCGIGITKMFLKKGNIILSDVESHPWIDRQEDALNLSYEDESLDVIICSNMIHHLPHPLKFFKETRRVLKKGGRLLIQEVNCSFMLQRLLRLMQLEDFNFKVDVFNVSQICTNPNNPWDGNNAIPNLLFDDVNRFEKKVPYFKILEQRHSEFFVYLFSGGINKKTFTIPLPYAVLKVLDGIDNILISTLPGVFALQRRIALEKK